MTRHLIATATRTTRLVEMLLLCCMIILLCAPSATATPSTARRPFRCFRPFDALDAFAPSAMHSNDNCRFDFVRVEHAAVSLHCQGDGEQLASSTSASATDDTAGCYATLSVDFATTNHRLDAHRLPSDAEMEATSGGRAHYHPRYTLELRAVNHSTVAYKGFDGVGYDLCCDFLNSSAASCSWSGHADDVGAKRPQRHVVDYCALLDRATPQGTTLHGSARKPLHRVIPGAWELKMVVYRGQTVVGRLMVPFAVTQADLESTLNKAGAQQAEAAASAGGQHASSAVSAVVTAAAQHCGRQAGDVGCHGDTAQAEE